MEGWICPRCGKVNAPWVSECNCNCGCDKITCVTVNTNDETTSCTTISAPKFETTTTKGEQLIYS